MNKVIIRNGKIIKAEATTQIPNELAARHRREAQKVKYRKEMLQPNQVDYYKANPDQAKDLSPELKRHLL